MQTLVKLLLKERRKHLVEDHAKAAEQVKRYTRNKLIVRTAPASMWCAHSTCVSPSLSVAGIGLDQGCHANPGASD